MAAPAHLPTAPVADGRPSGAVPATVRRRLLAEAPRLQSDSEIVRYWEAGGALFSPVFIYDPHVCKQVGCRFCSFLCHTKYNLPTMPVFLVCGFAVSRVHHALFGAGQSAMQGNRGIEIANHWGPVDMDTELSALRRAELFGHVAQYYTPSEPEPQREGQGTGGDAQLAAALQQREVEGQRAGLSVRRRIPVRHALERKLLSKRAGSRTQADLERADALVHKDLSTNKFSTTIN